MKTAPSRGPAQIAIAQSGSRKNCRNRAYHFWERCGHTNDESQISQSAQGGISIQTRMTEIRRGKIVLAICRKSTLNSRINHER
jgi:hypothetical protein